MNGLASGDPLLVAVTAAGIIAMAVILWLFLRQPRRGPTPAVEIDEVLIEIDQGYRPAVVVLRRGIPVKLRFIRADDSSETGEVFIPWYHIHRKLPALKTTTIDLQADEAGDFEFHSRTGSVRGRIVVLGE